MASSRGQLYDRGEVAEPTFSELIFYFRLRPMAKSERCSP
jgi:hypothetical protein